MPLIAVTGGIAAGKSEFTRRSAAVAGAESIDTDILARQLLDDNADVAAAVRAEFGADALDASGKPSRAALREIVFGDRERRKALEAILHPRIRAGWTGWAGERRRLGAILLVQIPLLYETGAEEIFDRSIAVGCSRESQIRRLTEDRRLSRQTAEQIIGSQWPLAEKIRRCDCLIWNNGSRAALDAQVDLCAHQLSLLRHSQPTSRDD